MASRRSSNKTQATKATKASVAEFIRRVDDAEKREDSQALQKMMRAATGKRAKMWGSSIIGFGQYHYRYDSGREGDHMVVGFSPRKTQLTIYIMPGFSHWPQLMTKLGKHKHSKSCLYIKRLADVDLTVLDQLIRESVKYMRDRYQTDLG